ncbi:MAG: FtsW/RodA/SpoVE family cell cycle protein [Bacteroidales bacterium]|nr:FtsW/RodA/SpoVE family cell cycle protein [Bacteroidales bacterium]
MEFLFRYLKGDRVLWITVFMLMIFSLPIVFSAMSTLAYKSSIMMVPIIKHSVLLVVGFVTIVFMHRVSYKYLSTLSIYLYWIAVGLLAVTLVFGQNLNSAVRSLNILGVSFQTSDFAKMVLIFYVSRVLSMNQDDLNNFRKVLIPLVIRILLICGLILPANLSTAGLLFLVILAIMFIAGVKFYNLALITFTIILSLGIAMFALKDYVPRIETWISRVEQFTKSDEEKGNDDKSFQEIHSKIAIATGGPFGKGPGHSTQRNVLPHPYSDFAYAMIIEEYGILGAILVLMAYLWLIYRSWVISQKADSFFGSLIAIGLGLGLLAQAFINMGVCVGILPVTGQPLPFISMGGTSVFFSSIAVGVMLNISKVSETAKVEAS